MSRGILKNSSSGSVEAKSKQQGGKPSRASLVGLLQQLFPSNSNPTNSNNGSNNSVGDDSAVRAETNSNDSIGSSIGGTNRSRLQRIESGISYEPEEDEGAPVITEVPAMSTQEEIEQALPRDSVSIAKQRRRAKRRKSAEQLTSSIISAIEVDMDLRDSQKTKAAANLMNAILCIDDEDLTDDEFCMSSDTLDNIDNFLTRDSVDVTNQRKNQSTARNIRQAIAELTSSITSIDMNMLDLTEEDIERDIDTAMKRDSISVEQQRRQRTARRKSRLDTANNLAASLIKILDADESILSTSQRRKSSKNLQSAIMKLDQSMLEEIEDDSEDDNDSSGSNSEGAGEE